MEFLRHEVHVLLLILAIEEFDNKGTKAHCTQRERQGSCTCGLYDINQVCHGRHSIPEGSAKKTLSST